MLVELQPYISSSDSKITLYLGIIDHAFCAIEIGETKVTVDTKIAEAQTGPQLGAGVLTYVMVHCPFIRYNSPINLTRMKSRLLVKLLAIARFLLKDA